jgi:hypothetical protein
MNWGKTPPPTVRAEVIDFGSRIGLIVEFNGKRTAFRIDNPLWAEIDAEWHRAHPDAPRLTSLCCNES